MVPCREGDSDEVAATNLTATSGHLRTVTSMIDATDPFAALDIAKHAGPPTNVLLKEVGAEVEGIVESVTVADSDYKDNGSGAIKRYPIVMLRKRDGSIGILRCYQTALQDLGNCQPGDVVYVKYDGDSEKHVKGREPAKLFTKIVVRNGSMVMLSAWNPNAAAIDAYLSRADETTDLKPF